MTTSTARGRLALIWSVAVSVGVASVSCSAILGADFNVELEDAGANPDGGGGGSSSVSSGDTSSATSSGTGGGASCLPSSCKPEVVSSEDNPLGIAAFGDWVYWTSGGPAPGMGAVKRSQVSGPIVAPTVLLSDLISPNQIAVDASHVYWTTISDAAAVFCAPIIGALTPKPVATSQKFPIGIAVNATTVYWTTGDGQVSMTAAGCPTKPVDPVPLSSGMNTPSLLALTSDSVFVTEYSKLGRVIRIALLDGKATDLAVDLDTPNGIIDRKGAVCYALALKTGGVYCIDIKTSIVTTIATNQNTPATLTVDRADNTLYWANSGSSTIMRSALGDAMPTQIADAQSFASGMAIAGPYVYWTNVAPKGMGGGVMRLRIH